MRNLTAGEIIEQMLRLARLLPQEERLSHIVVMGMGEPLANLDNLLPALGEATSPTGLGIGHRRITISTVGLPPAIRRLADLDSRFQLAVSLHAPNDHLRTELVPVNKNIGLDAIIAAADHYFEVSGRRLTFEYVLLGGLNDQPQHAHKLAKLLDGKLALLNVIPYNPVAGLRYHAPTRAAQQRFIRNPPRCRHQRASPRAQRGRNQRRLRPVAAAGRCRRRSDGLIETPPPEFAEQKRTR